MASAYDFRPPQTYKRNATTFSANFQPGDSPYAKFAQRMFGGDQNPITELAQSQQFAQPQQSMPQAQQFAAPQVQAQQQQQFTPFDSPQAKAARATATTPLNAQTATFGRPGPTIGSEWYPEGGGTIEDPPNSWDFGDNVVGAPQSGPFMGAQVEEPVDDTVGMARSSTGDTESFADYVNGGGTLDYNSWVIGGKPQPPNSDTTTSTELQTVLSAIEDQYGESLDAALGAIKREYDAWRTRMESVGGDYGGKGAYEEALRRGEFEQLDAQAQARISNAVAMTQDVSAAIWDDYTAQRGIKTDQMNWLLESASADPNMFGIMFGGMLMGLADSGMWGDVDIMGAYSNGLPTLAGSQWMANIGMSYTDEAKLREDLGTVITSAYTAAGLEVNQEAIDSAVDQFVAAWSGQNTGDVVETDDIPQLPMWTTDAWDDETNPFPEYWEKKYPSINDEKAVRDEMYDWIRAGYLNNGYSSSDVEIPGIRNEIREKVDKNVKRWLARLANAGNVA